LTMQLAVDLVRHIHDMLPILDKHGFKSIKSSKLHAPGAKKAHATLAKPC
jgi:hypothetical protein